MRGNHGREIGPNLGILRGPPRPAHGCHLRGSGCWLSQARWAWLRVLCAMSSRGPMEEELCHLLGRPLI